MVCLGLMRDVYNSAACVVFPLWRKEAVCEWANSWC